jgi:hypothetical protein
MTCDAHCASATETADARSFAEKKAKDILALKTSWA